MYTPRGLIEHFSNEDEKEGVYCLHFHRRKRGKKTNVFISYRAKVFRSKLNFFSFSENFHSRRSSTKQTNQHRRNVFLTLQEKSIHHTSLSQHATGTGERLPGWSETNLECQL